MTNIKEQLHNKSLAEIEALIYDHEQKIKTEKNLNTLYRLNSELVVMKEVAEQKLEKNNSLIHKNTSSPGKPALKSYDDYLKTKKK